jgi:hypothetical protein
MGRLQELDMLSLSSNHIAYICAVTVFACALRGATGFGAAAAMPLMGLVVPIKVLVPAWTVLSLCGAVTILGRDRLDRPDGAAGAAWVHSTNLTLEFRPDRWPTVIPRLFTSDAVGFCELLEGNLPRSW